MTQPPLLTTVDITSSGVSQIAESLLHHAVPISTIHENEMVQVGSSQEQFLTTGITHPMEPDTIVLQHNKPEELKSSTQLPIADRRTTVRVDDTTEYTPVVHISISNGPSYHTPTPGFQKPMFRPKPPQKPSDADKYVLVPTITHTVKPNKTQDFESVVNIMNILNETTTHSSYYGTSKKPPSTSYVYSSISTRKPEYGQTTTRKPPSTSYVYSSTPVPSRPTTKRKTQKPSSSSTYTTASQPIKISSNYFQSSSSTYNYPTTTTKRPTTNEYIYSSSFRPHSTIASSPDAFLTTNRPPSTSYLYSSSPTRRPPLQSTISSFVSGPTFAVSNNPGQFSSIPSPAPTLIVLGPVESETSDQSTRRPIDYSTAAPVRKPVTQLTINNHITQNIYSTERPPSPTVLITPKPSISTSYPIRRPTTEFQTAPVELQTSSNDLINFPPVRNPNLNMSAALLDDSDVTTPAFIEDQVLDQKVESFVNKIIEGLQEPFQDLKDVVYDKNKTQSTAKPTKKPASTTKRPATKATTRKPSTSRPGSTLSTRRPSTTTKRTKTTKRQPTTTTTESYIEANDDAASVEDNGDYRKRKYLNLRQKK